MCGVELDDTDSQTLLEAIQAADTLLDDLVQLSAMIRRASRSSHNAKADRSFRSDDCDLQDLLRHLTLVVSARPSFLEAERDAIWMGVDSASLEDNICRDPLAAWRKRYSANYSILTPIQNRLIKANLRRSHRFRWSQKQILRRGNHSLPSTINAPVQPSMILRSEPESVPQLDTDPPDKDDNTFVEPWAAQEQHGTIPAPSNTTLSVIESKVLDQTEPSTATSQRSGTSASGIAARIKTLCPRPPQIGPKSQILRCPCCCEILQKADLKDHRWRYVISCIGSLKKLISQQKARQ